MFRVIQTDEEYWSVVTSFLCNPVDSLMLTASGLPHGTKTTELPLWEAQDVLTWSRLVPALDQRLPAELVVLTSAPSLPVILVKINEVVQLACPRRN